MPNQNSQRLKIHFDLLHPQSNPIQIPVKILQWLLSTGRYIFIFVEGLVLLAFLARFKLDADLTTLNESIEEQIPYIESLKPYETRIRQTQFQLSNISTLNQQSGDFGKILKKIAAQTPIGVKVENITFDKVSGKIDIKITGQSLSNKDVSIFVYGLKSDKYFDNVTLTNIGFESKVIKFSIIASGSIAVQGEIQ